MSEIRLIIKDLSGIKKLYLVQNSGLSECLKESTKCSKKFGPHLSDRQICQAHFYHRNEKIFLILNSYLLVKFLCELRNSNLYRNAWISTVRRLQNTGGAIQEIYIYEILPEKPYIDHAWCWRVEKLALERQELENTMSWLSTLGGAFSALGEEFSRCALIAGRISVAQFKLGVRLGDPGTQSRCRLYLALSLLQQGRLRTAKYIIRREFALAMGAPEEMRDVRLVRMCHGIWAKLKYSYWLRKHKRDHY